MEESVVDNDLDCLNLAGPKDDVPMLLSAYRPPDEREQTLGRFFNRAQTLLRMSTTKDDAKPATTSPPGPCLRGPR